MAKITGTLHEYQCEFFIISRSHLILSDISDKIFRENQTTHLILKFILNLTFFEIM